MPWPVFFEVCSACVCGRAWGAPAAERARTRRRYADGLERSPGALWDFSKHFLEIVRAGCRSVISDSEKADSSPISF